MNLLFIPESSSHCIHGIWYYTCTCFYSSPFYWFFIFFFFREHLEDNRIYRMEPVEIQEIFVYMKQMAFMAGEMVKDGFNKPKNIDSKTSEVDLVTETDKAVEDYIISSILGQYPDMVLT